MGGGGGKVANPARGNPSPYTASSHLLHSMGMTAATQEEASVPVPVGDAFATSPSIAASAEKPSLFVTCVGVNGASGNVSAPRSFTESITRGPNAYAPTPRTLAVNDTYSKHFSTLCRGLTWVCGSTRAWIVPPRIIIGGEAIVRIAPGIQSPLPSRRRGHGEGNPGSSVDAAETFKPS